MLNTESVTPKDVPALLETSHELQLAPMLWGSPGIGKTQSIYQYAKRVEEKTGQECKLIDLRLTQIEAVDLRGLTIPDMANGVTKYLRPDFLAMAPGSQGIIFLDEITRAEPRLQASAFSLLCERRVGDVQIPDGWLICAAGNGVEHSEFTFEVDAALADRLVHVKVVADVDSWIDWGRNSNEIAPEVISFIKLNPNLLEACEERIRQGRIIGPSPRGWHKVSRVLRATRDEKQRESLVSGIVGQEASAEFFLTIEELEKQADVAAMFKEDDAAKLKRMLPTTLAGLWRMAYAIPGLVSNAKEGIKGLSLILLLDELEKDHDELPVAEVKVLAAELLFEKCTKIGQKCLADVATSDTYAEYDKRRQELLSGGRKRR